MSTPESIQPIPDSGPVTITAKKQPHGEATFSVDDFPVEGAYLVLSADEKSIDIALPEGASNSAEYQLLQLDGQPFIPNINQLKSELAAQEAASSPAIKTLQLTYRKKINAASSENVKSSEVQASSPDDLPFSTTEMVGGGGALLILTGLALVAGREIRKRFRGFLSEISQLKETIATGNTERASLAAQLEEAIRLKKSIESTLSNTQTNFSQYITQAEEVVEELKGLIRQREDAFYGLRDQSEEINVQSKAQLESMKKAEITLRNQLRVVTGGVNRFKEEIKIYKEIIESLRSINTDTKEKLRMARQKARDLENGSAYRTLVRQFEDLTKTLEGIRRANDLPLSKPFHLKDRSTASLLS